jgi:DNA-binding MarR family transcriptional regulator
MVVDEDRPGALDALGLPATYTVRTARGGRHAYLWHIEGIRNSASLLSEGVDVRAEGGYVIVPPSPGYTVADRSPVAEAPAELVQRLLKPDRPRLEALEGGGELEPTRSRLEIPARITEGSRNGTLYRYGCSLRAHGHEHAAILEELRKANAERCAPPLEDRELHKIAVSASGHDKGNASTILPEVLEAVSFLSEKAWNRPRKGTAAHSRWAVYLALLDCAWSHGWMHQGRDVALRISVRQLTEDAGITRRTTHRALDALDEARLVHRLSSGEGVIPGVLVLRAPRRGSPDTTRTTGGQGPTGVSNPPSGGEGLHRLRHGYSLGKVYGGVLWEILEQPGITRAEIGKRLCRSGESLKEMLRKLRDLGLVENQVRGRYWLCEDWRHVLHRERTMSGEEQAERIQRAKHEREREAYARYLEGDPSQGCAYFPPYPPPEDAAPAGYSSPSGDALRRSYVGSGESAVRELVRQGMEAGLACVAVWGDPHVMLE